VPGRVLIVVVVERKAKKLHLGFASFWFNWTSFDLNCSPCIRSVGHVGNDVVAPRLTNHWRHCTDKIRRF
jgi:hypothetical protein